MTKNGQPGHYTQHNTRKFQCNGRVAWASTFRRAAAGAQEGDGIRAALAYAVGHADAFLAWSKAHPADWQRAPSAPVGGGKAPGKAVKRSAGAKRGKGKVKRAGAKGAGRAPKALKPAGLAKVSEALGRLAEQAALPGVK